MQPLLPDWAGLAGTGRRGPQFGNICASIVNFLMSPLPPSLPPRSLSSPQDAVGWRSRPRYKAVNEFGVTQPMHFICPSVISIAPATVLFASHPILHLQIDRQSIASSIHRRISCLARSRHVFFRAPPCRQTSGRLSRAKAIPSIMFIYHGRTDGRRRTEEPRAGRHHRNLRGGGNA